MKAAGDTRRERDVRSVVETYFELLNGDALAELAALFAEDAELVAPGAGIRRGRERIESYYRSALAPYPEHLDLPTRVLVSGSSATVEIRFEGRLANGQRLAFDAVDVFDVRGGEIARLTSWYDSSAVRRSLAQALAADGPSAGELDRLGSVAEATPARLQAALPLVRRGVSFRLDLPLGTHPPLFGRGPLLHHVFLDEEGPPAEDDRLDAFFPQGGSHWDALRHLLPGRPELGIDLWSRGILARAVVLDLGADLGLSWDEPRALRPEEIEESATRRGVPLRAGDALLLRTGWLRGYLEAGVPAEGTLASPGLDPSQGTVEWLRSQRFAAVAADNPGLEVLPQRAPEAMLHAGELAKLGLAVGELWWLDDLCADCEADGVWEGLLVSVPLNLPGGCGSPANAVVLK